MIFSMPSLRHFSAINDISKNWKVTSVRKYFKNDKMAYIKDLMKTTAAAYGLDYIED